MPMLFVPMIWAFSIAIVQQLRDFRLLTSISLLVLSQSIYTWLGLRWQVSSPVSRETAQDFALTVRKYERCMHILAMVCVTWYLAEVGWKIYLLLEAEEGIVRYLVEEGREHVLPLL